MMTLVEIPIGTKHVAVRLGAVPRSSGAGSRIGSTLPNRGCRLLFSFAEDV